MAKLVHLHCPKCTIKVHASFCLECECFTEALFTPIKRPDRWEHILHGNTMKLIQACASNNFLSPTLLTQTSRIPSKLHPIPFLGLPRGQGLAVQPQGRRRRQRGRPQGRGEHGRDGGFGCHLRPPPSSAEGAAQEDCPVQGTAPIKSKIQLINLVKIITRLEYILEMGIVVI